MKIRLIAANLLFVATAGVSIAMAQDPGSKSNKDGRFLPSAPDGAGGGGITITDPVTKTFCENFTVNGGCADKDGGDEKSEPVDSPETSGGADDRDSRNPS